MKTPQISKIISKSAGYITLFTGCLVLTGWIFDILPLKSILPQWVSMKANTAIAFVLCGISLLLIHQKKNKNIKKYIIIASSAIIFTIGLLTLTEYIFKINIGIDQFFFKESLTNKNLYPGRMSPISAFNFVMLGISLSLIWVDEKKVIIFIQYSIIAVIILSFMAAVSYLYNEKTVYGFGSFSAIALHTAILFIIFSTGILFLHISTGPVKAIARRTTVSLMMIGAAVILIFAGEFSINDQKIFIDSNYSAQHTLKIISAIEEALSLLKDVETGYRGYLITADRAYLEPYETAVSPEGLPKMLNTLHLYLDNDEEQMKSLDKIIKLTEKMLDLIRGSIKFMDKNNYAAAVNMIRSGTGKKNNG